MPEGNETTRDYDDPVILSAAKDLMPLPTAGRLKRR
jgi:hypothetical protein